MDQKITTDSEIGGFSTHQVATSGGLSIVRDMAKGISRALLRNEECIWMLQVY